jgi:hypothetical protein
MYQFIYFYSRSRIINRRKQTVKRSTFVQNLLFSFGHCVVCPCSIFGFLLPLWQLNQKCFNIGKTTKGQPEIENLRRTDNTMTKWKGTKQWATTHHTETQSPNNRGYKVPLVDRGLPSLAEFIPCCSGFGFLCGVLSLIVLSLLNNISTFLLDKPSESYHRK